jgi:hypothetical protein
MDIGAFLQALYGKAPSGFLTLWTMPDKRTAYFPVDKLPAAVDYAAKRRDTHDIYFGVGLRREDKGEYARGGNEDVSVIPAFWSDVDILGPAHKETALPPTADAALAFLGSLPLKPSIVVNSGNGLHVYWLFAEPVGVATEAHRNNVAGALRGWQAYVNEAARDRGWKLDNTSDMSRVLRLPGSVNRKNGGSVAVEVIAESGARYAPSDFTPYIQHDAVATYSPVANRSAEGTAAFSGKVGGGERILEKCAFIRRCRDNAASLPEPMWYAMLGNLVLCSDGETLCHQFSRAYPGYKEKETADKIAHARKAAKPHTCAYIRDTLGFDCGGCAVGCKAPVALAVITKADTVRELLAAEIEDYNRIYSDEYIDALSYAKANLPGEYAQFKSRHKGKISVRDMEACIKARDRKQRGSEDEEEVLCLDGIDLHGAVIPRKWQITDKGGVRRAFATKDGEGEIIACPNPVVITRRLSNIDDGKERLELCFKKDGRWKPIVGGRTQVYNKASIISFGDDGLGVTSGTASGLVEYLFDYETANQSRIPLVSSISRLGWIDDTRFFPYSVKEEILFEEDKGTAALYRSLVAQGDFDVWKTMMRKLRENPVARFVTSSSFASPLLCKIGVRTFVIHLWHMSASGKSAALKAAISVWGNPLRIMGNGFTTVVGTEQLAGTLRNLPFGIDEKQSADERKLSLEHLIYVLGQGSGKIRGARGGGNAEVAVWHNIVMLTGEEPVTKSSSLDGIQTRTFELYGKPVEDIEFAKEVHLVSEQNFGYAGAAFMRAVCGMLAEDKDFLRREYQAISDAYRDKGLRNIHADYVAAVTLGDVLAEVILFGTDPDTARRGAIACGEEIYRLNEAQMSMDVVQRAWDFITGWLVSNEQRFSPEAIPCFGKVEQSPGRRNAEYFVIPLHLDKALEEAGFNVRKTFQGLRERGFLTTQVDSEGKERTKTDGWVCGKHLRGYVFRLQSGDIPPLRGPFDDDD